MTRSCDREFVALHPTCDETISKLLSTLWDIYVGCGEDPDGDTKFHCSPEDAARYTLMAVGKLRSDYDEACSEVAHVGISIAERERDLDEAKKERDGWKAGALEAVNFSRELLRLIAESA